MFDEKKKLYVQKKELYAELCTLLTALTESEFNPIANLANASALLHFMLDDINWVGFYLYEDNQLILGPFQGKPACVRIPMGRGVCGTAAEQCKTQLVKNVHDFPGHIACDSASKSEIVIPLIVNQKLYGVLDIDAPILERFDREDQNGLESFVQILEKSF